MSELRHTKINDMLTMGGCIRADGVMVDAWRRR
jgi:hypothetical protein